MAPVMCLGIDSAHMGRCECSLPVHDTVTGGDVLKQSDAVSVLTCAYVRLCLRTHVMLIAETDMQKGKTTSKAE